MTPVELTLVVMASGLLIAQSLLLIYTAVCLPAALGTVLPMWLVVLTMWLVTFTMSAT